MIGSSQMSSRSTGNSHKRAKSIPDEQDAFGNIHNFDFSVVDAEEEKEIYLLLVVHGIGSDIGTQVKNKKGLEIGIDKIIKENKHFASDYNFVVEIINWKEVIEKSNMTEKLDRCRIKTQTRETREVFDYTIPDAIAYMNPRFRANVLKTVV